MRSKAASCLEEGAETLTPSNPFGDPGDQNDPNADNASFQELRLHAESLEKQLKASQKEVGVLQEFKAGADKAAQVAAAQTSGLTEKQAQLFLTVHEGDITPEAVASFKTDYGFADATPAPAVTEGGPANDGATQQPSGFVPASAGGTPANAARLSYDDYKVLLGTNFNEAARAVAEGRVDGIYSNPE